MLLLLAGGEVPEQAAGTVRYWATSSAGLRAQTRNRPAGGSLTLTGSGPFDLSPPDSHVVEETWVRAGILTR